MGTTIAGIATIAVLCCWHLKVRRHPSWRHQRDARFFITTAYPTVAIAVYFLLDRSNGTWIWALGCLWALIAMGLFVYGFQLLNAAPPREPVSRQPANRVRRTLEPTVERKSRWPSGTTNGGH